jgi:hypothetical protein
VIARDRLIEWIELRRIQLLVVLSALLVVMILLLIVLSSFDSPAERAAKEREAAMRALAFRTDELLLPAEPFPVPGFQYYREPRPNWTQKDVNEWYTVPDADSLGALQTAARKQIDQLMESVP